MLEGDNDSNGDSGVEEDVVEDTGGCQGSGTQDDCVEEASKEESNGDEGHFTIFVAFKGNLEDEDFAEKLNRVVHGIPSIIDLGKVSDICKASLISRLHALPNTCANNFLCYPILHPPSLPIQFIVFIIFHSPSRLRNTAATARGEMEQCTCYLQHPQGCCRTPEAAGPEQPATAKRPGHPLSTNRGYGGAQLLSCAANLLNKFTLAILT